MFGVFLGLKFSFSRSLVCFFFFSRILALSLRIVSPSKRASPNICTATGLFICKQVGIFKKFTSFFMFVSFSWLRICQGWQVGKKGRGMKDGGNISLGLAAIIKIGYKIVWP